MTDRRDYPEARRPDRMWRVAAAGAELAAYAWGDPGDPVMLLAHGGMDFAGTLDVFAPKLAAGGWQVVSWDQRGHGDSEHPMLYSWEADLRDAVAVLDTVGGGPVPLVGHSKGGGLMMALADCRPDLATALVNLDGLPSKRNRPDVSDRERRRMLAADLAAWLDFRRRAHEAARKPGTIEELARRRARLNNRLPIEWLEYLVTIGARHDADGWRWKLDPSLRFGGFGPIRPEWSLQRLPGLRVPLLGVLGLEMEEMGWGTVPGDVQPWLPRGARFEVLEGVGHFVHIEQPDAMSELVLEFLS